MFKNTTTIWQNPQYKFITKENRLIYGLASGAAKLGVKTIGAGIGTVKMAGQALSIPFYPIGWAVDKGMQGLRYTGAGTEIAGRFGKEVGLGVGGGALGASWELAQGPLEAGYHWTAGQCRAVVGNLFTPWNIPGAMLTSLGKGFYSYPKHLVKSPNHLVAGYNRVMNSPTTAMSEWRDPERTHIVDVVGSARKKAGEALGKAGQKAKTKWEEFSQQYGVKVPKANTATT